MLDHGWLVNYPAGMLRRRGATADPDPPSSLDVLRSATRRLERARELRDYALIAARAEHNLRDVAEAADLSVSRVKQLTGTLSSAGSHGTLPPVTEVDLWLDQWELQRGDRVLALEDVDPFLPRWSSERAFLQGNPKRQVRPRPDISYDVYDTDPATRWIVAYTEQTQEVYAFQNVPGSNDADPDFKPHLGSHSGPCVLLGHLPTEGVVDAALYTSTSIVANRLGGLAWIYGRVRLVNRLLKAFTDPIRGLLPRAEEAWTYLQSLPMSERP
jgi:hypothetical protein